MKQTFFVLSALAATIAGAAAQGSAPGAINYQGVLLDNLTGSPQSGDRDMIFHFYDGAGGGEILRDRHTLSDSTPVVVDMGTFNVQLGTGLIEDGPAVFPNDPYTSLSQVFRDFAEVLLGVEIRVGPAGGGGAFETLSPRTRIVSAAYAINSGLLGGKPSAEFIDRSSTSQTKAGNLTVANLTASGNTIAFSSAGASISASSTSFFINAGNQDTDNLFLIAGNSGDDGGITIFGDGIFEMRSGNGHFSFVDGVTLQERAHLNGTGDLQLDGDLTLSGNELFLGSTGGKVWSNALSTSVLAGDQDSDMLFFTAGNGFEDGEIALFGGGAMALRSATGEFNFRNGNQSVGPQIVASTASLRLKAGGDDADSLLLEAGNTSDDGHLYLFGAGSAELVTRTSVTFRIDSASSPSSYRALWCKEGCFFTTETLMELQEDGDLRIGGVLSQNQFDLAESYMKGEAIEPGDVVRLHPGRAGAVLLSSGIEDATVLGVVSERPGVVLGGAPFDPEALERMWGPSLVRRFLEERDVRLGRLLDAQPDLAERLERFEHAAVSQAGGGTADPPADPASDRAERELAELRSHLETTALESFYRDNFVPVALAGRVPVKVDAGFGRIAAGDRLSPSPVPGVAMKSDGRGLVIGIALEPFTGGRGKVEAFITHDFPEASQDEVRRPARETLAGTEAQNPAPDPAGRSLPDPASLHLVVDPVREDGAGLSVSIQGQGEDPRSELFRVDDSGDVYASRSFRPEGSNVAELFAVSEVATEGDVLVADPAHPGSFRPARDPGDPSVVGVVSSRAGMLLGGGIEDILSSNTGLAERFHQARAANDRQGEARIWSRLEADFMAARAPVAMTGTVQVKVDASYGAIRTGDLLISSPTAGHAMRAEDPAAQGTVVGKALEPLESGRGLIRMLAMLR